MRVVEPHEFKGVKHPSKKRGRKSGWRIIIALIVVVYVGGTLVRPVPAITSSVSALTPLESKKVDFKWPSHGQAAVGAVGYGVLGTFGEQKALPMASVAKVMTALAVLKQKPLKVGEQGPTITITQEDVDYYQKVVSQDGSNVPVVVGEEITEYEALQALLLPSANNMAHTLAVWAYGSEKQYTSYVNNLSKTLGMNNAHFEDASGFSSKTVASSEDLARLAVNAMDNPVIAEIAAQPEATIPVAGRIYNVNMLLGRDGIVGVKTGNTEEAGGCFMAAAERVIAGQKVVAVSVIMGANNLSEALRNSVPLINSVFAGFEEVALVKANQTIGSYNVPWSGSVNVVAKQDVKGVVWRGTPIKPEVTLDSLTASASAVTSGTAVGTIRGSFGRTQADSPALLSGTIQKPPALWRFKPRFI